uniref:Uncharacterized protein n=1 Tax=Romanomermis culicivorax TaxID=13658 RepID=A0A915IES2_ROMCU
LGLEYSSCALRAALLYPKLCAKIGFKKPQSDANQVKYKETAFVGSPIKSHNDNNIADLIIEMQP